MRFSKTSVMALDALVVIGRNGAFSPIPLRQIAGEIKASPTYLSKILQHLSSAGLVVAVMGAHGGYRPAKKMSEISILEVVELFEKPATVGGEPVGKEEKEKKDGTAILSKALLAALANLSQTTVADIID